MTRRRARPPLDLVLPELSPFEDGELEPEGDYEGVEFRGLDLGGQDGAQARFLECGLYGCALTETRLARARLVECVVQGATGVGLDAAGSVWRDVLLEDARLGGTQAHGATFERVLVRGGKIDYVNFRGARLADVRFEGCTLSDADFGGAVLERVVFTDCRLRQADFSGAKLDEVDLRGVVELEIERGVESLGGAVISPSQLLDLAPAFAAQVGVRVLHPGETGQTG